LRITKQQDLLESQLIYPQAYNSPARRELTSTIMPLGQTLGNKEVPVIPHSHSVLWLIVNVFTGGLGTVGAGIEGHHTDTIIIGAIQFLITWVFCWTFV
jgi:hypothetical protein